MQGEFLETAVWYEVCELLTHPERLEHEYQDGGGVGASLERVETLKVQPLKLQHALERLIDTFREGLIEKDQFTSRMTRTIAEPDTKIKDDAGEVDQRNTCDLLQNAFAISRPQSGRIWPTPTGIAVAILSARSFSGLKSDRRSSRSFSA